MKRLSRFKRGFVSTFVLDVTARGMSAVTLILLLRTLAVGDFAFVVLLLNVGNFLGSAATGGVRLRYTRLEAERVSRGHEEPSAFHATLLSGSALILAAGALGLLGASVLGVGGAGERLAFVAIGIVFTLGSAAVEMAVFHYQAQLAFLRAGLIQILRGVVLLAIAGLATAGLLESGEAIGVYFSIGVGLVGLAVAGPLALATRGAKHGIEGRFGFGRETAALTLYSMAASGWAYLDLFLVAALLSDTAVAAYGAALRYVSIVMGPVPAMVSVLRVRTAQSDMIDSDEAQIGMMRRWAKQTAPPALVLLGLAAIAAIWAIPLIDGGRYPDSVPIFQVLMLTAFAQFVTLPNSSLLIAQERYTTLAWVNAAAVGLNVVAATIAAELFGVVGIAIAGALVTIGQVSTVTLLAANPGRAESDEHAAAAA
ncbi:MAG TPA: lipopolysaccharide biosynthesis protein [Solirubrobacterales bacterium]|nr:lipopolysaccharide biosynthesis protein [Solirubrobacterales bacterium]